MTPLTVITLEDLKDRPQVKLALAHPLRAGDRIQLNFRLKRLSHGRQEVLLVKGIYRVAEAIVDQEGRQSLKVESTGLAPSWQAVRKEAPFVRRLGPTHYPPTRVG